MAARSTWTEGWGQEGPVHPHEGDHWETEPIPQPIPEETRPGGDTDTGF